VASPETESNQPGAALPRRFGKYEVLDVIGQGAFGTVYVGHDPFAGRKVAIKAARSAPSEESSRLSQRLFFNEARLAGLLDHPNILAVHDAGEEDGVPYLVMDFVDGARTLKEFCGHERLLPVRGVVEILFKCARALEYAHRMGVVHRDIKPSNILLTRDGDVKIADFGIAQRAQSDTTQVLGMVGSPRYMSPEQALEGEITGQSDIYSLGVVMFELLTGRPPFHGENLSRLIQAILNDPPPRPRELRADVPEALEAIILKALAKDRAERYASGGDLAADLARAFEHLEHVETEIDERERFGRARALAFFRDFSDVELWEVVRSATWEGYTTGDRIVTEGALEERLYVIAAGDVMVRKGKRVLSTLGPGDCFGEMGYLGRTKRTASIVAVNEVNALSVSGALIDQLSPATQARFLRSFVKTLVTRLARASEQLSRQ
jgi:tRNA A-37 threonylcarbamoyl transferase component Bud32